MVTRLATKILALTFVRTSELIGTRWSEFDIEARRWNIPAERMKMKEEHIVPLSKQAIATLRELEKLTGNRLYIFPNQHNAATFMSENTMLYALYRLITVNVPHYPSTPPAWLTRQFVSLW